MSGYVCIDGLCLRAAWRQTLVLSRVRANERIRFELKYGNDTTLAACEGECGPGRQAGRATDGGSILPNLGLRTRIAPPWGSDRAGVGRAINDSCLGWVYR
jgi:hypothetical protein